MPQAERISAQLRQRLSAAVAAAGEALVDGDNANGAAEPEVCRATKQGFAGMCALLHVHHAQQPRRRLTYSPVACHIWPVLISGMSKERMSSCQTNVRITGASSSFRLITAMLISQRDSGGR